MDMIYLTFMADVTPVALVALSQSVSALLVSQRILTRLAPACLRKSAQLCYTSLAPLAFSPDVARHPSAHFGALSTHEAAYKGASRVGMIYHRWPPRSTTQTTGRVKPRLVRN